MGCGAPSKLEHLSPESRSSVVPREAVEQHSARKGERTGWVEDEQEDTSAAGQQDKLLATPNRGASSRNKLEPIPGAIATTPLGKTMAVAKKVSDVLRSYAQDEVSVASGALGVQIFEADPSLF